MFSAIRVKWQIIRDCTWFCWIQCAWFEKIKLDLGLFKTKIDFVKDLTSIGLLTSVGKKSKWELEWSYEDLLDSIKETLNQKQNQSKRRLKNIVKRSEFLLNNEYIGGNCS